ncbi:asl7585 (plasmid) [Nostoc sp. PCC 7120 = FACHB-418]|nr:asl7585 [Nostoc sp. PCC 7120 = FACHB-418]
MIFVINLMSCTNVLEYLIKSAAPIIGRFAFVLWQLVCQLYGASLLVNNQYLTGLFFQANSQKCLYSFMNRLDISILKDKYEIKMKFQILS